MGRIVVIGAGIAGLSAAYELSRHGRHEIVLLEASERLGGKIVTHRSDGLLIEGGPDSVFTSKPWAVDLMKELGLESEFVEPSGSGFSILVGGKLHVVPRALASLMPTANSALESLGFFSASARKRVFSEKGVQKGTGDDESIASFFRRRFGSRFSKTIAEPLLAGIHAGSAERLSMKALYPTYIGMEQKYGSLTGDKPVTTPTGNGSGASKGGFLTLASGLSRFVEVLASKLDQVQIYRNFATQRVEKFADDSLRVIGDQTFDADAVILAVPANVAAPILANNYPDTARLLSAIRYASTAVITFAFPSNAFEKELHGNGFLVPAEEPANVTGCTFSSIKWPGRSPDGTQLIRLFVGRDGGFDVDSLSDDELIDKASATFRPLLHVKGQPSLVRVDRWTQAMPQYDLGHLDRIDAIESSLVYAPIYLTGGSYRGTGIPDCIRQGRQTATKVLEALKSI